MDAPLKKILRALSLVLRHTLEGTYTEDGTWNAGDLERRLNQIGIWRDRPVKPISEMPNLSPVDRKARELIDAYLALRSDAGVSQSDAVAEFIRESAYSWANRLFALRCMEARGIIDPVILQEEVYHGRSMVHDRFAQTNPRQCTDEDDGLFAMLSEEFQERSQELPDLFAPDSPAVALRPSVVALKHCIALLSGSAPANGGRATDDVFTAPDAFGWAYQYWNAEEKDRVFEMVRTKKGAKIEGSDIIPATQLYTEPYMVKFLVQNSLGATWMMMHPESKLSAGWEYYVKDADRTPNEKKPVAEITFLDPACGSGHFLIEAFDLLYAMYEEEGLLKEPAAICQYILNNNLFGIDIDERAVQITKAVLWMKAAETVFAKTKQQLMGDDFSEFHDHIIATNIRLPNGKDHLDAFLKKHPEDAPLRPALLTVFEGLQNVHELGSLVQIEEPVDKELKVLKEQAKQQRFDPDAGGEMAARIDFPRWKRQVTKRLKAHFQDEAEKAIPTEAFFSQSAVKGLALFDLLARRYDVVAANPPYMGNSTMGNILHYYINQNYEIGKTDIYAAFILRNQMLSNNNGRIAMVSMNKWMTLPSFEKLRNNNPVTESSKLANGLLYGSTLELLADLGSKAFSPELHLHDGVQVAIFVFSNKIPTNSSLSIFYDIKKIENPEKKGQILRDIRSCPTFKTRWTLFRSLPKSRIMYYAPNEVLNLFKLSNQWDLGDIKNSFAISRRGLDTCEVEKWVRYWWEVPQSKIAINKMTTSTHIWTRHARSSNGFRWAGRFNYAVKWGENGNIIKITNSAIIPNEDCYFKSGGTFSRIGQEITARILPKYTLISDSASGVFSNKVSPYVLVSLLNCRLISFLLRLINPTMNYQTGDINSLPVPQNHKYFTLLEEVSKKCETYRHNISRLDPIEFDFYSISKQEPTIQSLNKKILDQKLSLECTYAILKGKSDELAQKSFNCEGISPTILGKSGISYPIIKEYSNGKIDFYNMDDSVFLEKIFFESYDTKLFTNFGIESRKKLKKYYCNGLLKEKSEENSDLIKDNNEEVIDPLNREISSNPETFLEELSQKMELHPISIYWLLKDGIERENWRCIPEEKRNAENIFSVMILRMLGHRWPKQIEAGEPVPEWADVDGIIPITSGLMHPTLFQRVQERIAVEFPRGKVHEIEKEFEQIVGISLERWLEREFFKHHISQFKKRPIAWLLSSNSSLKFGGKEKNRGSRREPAFSCLVYYHKINADILHKIRTQYVGDLINRYGTELRGLENREKLTGDQATRKVQLNNWIAELNDFSKTLEEVADIGFKTSALNEIGKNEQLDKWTSRDGAAPYSQSIEEFISQEIRYDPDINDGVKINIAPLQKAGLISVDVIAKKDVEKAITDRAEWRADERRWCREGKLSKCGWWN